MDVVYSLLFLKLFSFKKLKGSYAICGKEATQLKHLSPT